MVQIFVDVNFQKCSNTAVFNDFNFQILCAGVVQFLSTSWTADPSHHLAFQTYLCNPSKPRNYGKTQHFAQFLPANISHVLHLRCKTSLLSTLMLQELPATVSKSRESERLNFL